MENVNSLVCRFRPRMPDILVVTTIGGAGKAENTASRK